MAGGTGQKSRVPDQRITNVSNLQAGPFQLTSTTLPYISYAARPAHRFYQMWQQLNCSTEQANWENPSGCNGKLFSWVEVTVGAGTDGTTQPTNFSTQTTGEGSTALGFYNVQQGDAPYFTYLANNYAMSDNFHQSVNGGTGANHIMFGHGDMLFFSVPNPNDSAHNLPAAPPNNVSYATNPVGYGVVVSEIENPNPARGTNNWYTEDGYGTDFNEGFPQSQWATAHQNGGPVIYGGGSYTNCADTSQPGVKPIREYLASMHIDAHCESGHYYLLNNYNPGYFGNGNNAYTDHNPSNTPFTIPPSTVPSIGDSLIAANISWKYYGDQWNAYVPDPYDLNYDVPGPASDEYCNICNPFQYDTSIMANSTVRQEHIQDTVDLYADITNGTLPAVSIVKPSGLVDGHPSSSKLDLFEGFVRKIVDQVEASPYASDTAIFITMDEGGGYYDSGFVHPLLDYFGDGTRIPLIVVAPKKYLRADGYISHKYADHVSILKFIERNWGLRPVTHRSRDNFPNPVSRPENPYVPVNAPALDDFFDFFRFYLGTATACLGPPRGGPVFFSRITLRETEPVAERIAEDGFDPIELILGGGGEADTAGGEFRVRSATIRRFKDTGAKGTFLHELHDAFDVLRLQLGPRRVLIENELRLTLALGAYRHPAMAAGQCLIRGQFEAELADVEVDGLLMVGYEDTVE